MKRYIADRVNGRPRVMVQDHDQVYPLRHIVLHSPTGFGWGYGGSAPADLALSILADFFGEDPSGSDLRWGSPRCAQFYQAFKWDFLAAAPLEGFELGYAQLKKWLWQQTAVGR